MASVKTPISATTRVIVVPNRSLMKRRITRSAFASATAKLTTTLNRPRGRNELPQVIATRTMSAIQTAI
jgi:hypothetical protein